MTIMRWISALTTSDGGSVALALRNVDGNPPGPP